MKKATVGNSVYNTMFCLSIWVENSEYKTNEPINCFASVTYYGQDDTGIYHTTPLVKLRITGNGKYDNYVYKNESTRTSFSPEQEIIFPFQKGGGWTQDYVHDNLMTVFDETIYGNKERCLPVGEYTLTADLEYWTDESDISGTLETLSVSVTVTVE